MLVCWEEADTWNGADNGGKINITKEGRGTGSSECFLWKTGFETISNLANASLGSSCSFAQDRGFGPWHSHSLFHSQTSGKSCGLGNQNLGSDLAPISSVSLASYWAFLDLSFLPTQWGSNANSTEYVPVGGSLSPSPVSTLAEIVMKYFCPLTDSWAPQTTSTYFFTGTTMIRYSGIN